MKFINNEKINVKIGYVDIKTLDMLKLPFDKA